MLNYGVFSIIRRIVICFFFFFQAEDGIRDLIVTGVQTCALPISCDSMAGLVIREPGHHPRARESAAASAAPGGRLLSAAPLPLPAKDASAVPRAALSIGPVLVGSK